MIPDKLKDDFNSLRNMFDELKREIDKNVVREENYKGEFYEISPYSYQRNRFKQGKIVGNVTSLKTTNNLFTYYFDVKNQIIEIREGLELKNLDIKSPKGFYFFHCTNIIDALIEKESDIVWLDKERGWVSCINKFVLDKNKIQEQTIFRLPNVNCRYTFYGEEFKNLVLKHHLQGIHFDRYETIIIK